MVKITKAVLIFLIFGALVSFSGAASAALLNGSYINYQYYYPTLGNPYSDAANGNYLVGSGVEIDNIVDQSGTLNISDNQLRVDFTRNVGFGLAVFNGFVIKDAFNAIVPFTSVSINGGTSLAGFNSSRVSFDADSIYVNMQGLEFSSGNIFLLDVNEVPVSSNAVAEPSTMALLGLGGMGMLFRRLRQKNS